MPTYALGPHTFRRKEGAITHINSEVGMRFLEDTIHLSGEAELSFEEVFLYAAALLLLYCCFIAALPLLYCCFTAALPLLYCCFTAALLLSIQRL